MGINLTDIDFDDGHSTFSSAPYTAALADLRDRTKTDENLRLTLQPVACFTGDTEAEAMQRAADWVAGSLGDSVILASWLKFHGDEGGDDYYEVGFVVEP
jgi:hypothetical protein